MIPYNHDYRHQYDILYNRIHRLNYYHQNAMGNSARIKFEKVIQFSSTTVYGTGKIYVIYFSDILDISGLV